MAFCFTRRLNLHCRLQIAFYAVRCRAVALFRLAAPWWFAGLLHNDHADVYRLFVWPWACEGPKHSAFLRVPCHSTSYNLAKHREIAYCMKPFHLPFSAVFFWLQFAPFFLSTSPSQLPQSSPSSVCEIIEYNLYAAMRVLVIPSVMYFTMATIELGYRQATSFFVFNLPFAFSIALLYYCC